MLVMKRDISESVLEGLKVGVEASGAGWRVHPGGSRVVVVISFLFVLGTNGRMQPVVMAPKNLSTKH